MPAWLTPETGSGEGGTEEGHPPKQVQSNETARGTHKADLPPLFACTPAPRGSRIAPVSFSCVEPLDG